jgi:hypothetical protein
VRVVADLDAALDELEAELLYRARQQHPASGSAWPVAPRCQRLRPRRRHRLGDQPRTGGSASRHPDVPHAASRNRRPVSAAAPGATRPTRPPTRSPDTVYGRGGRQRRPTAALRATPCRE